MNTHEDLRALQETIGQVFEGFVLPQSDRMRRCASQLAQSLQVEMVKPKLVDIETMYNRLRSEYSKDQDRCVENLSVRDRRYLPWTLFHRVEERAVSWPGLLGAALLELERVGRPTRLTGWIRAYLQYYEEEQAEFEDLREVLEAKLAEYKGTNPRLVFWKQRLRYLFSRSATRSAAAYLLSAAETSEARMKKLGLVEELSMGGFAIATVRAALQQVHERFPDGLGVLLDMLEVGHQNDGRLRNLDVAAEAVSLLIPAAGLEAGEDIREPLQSFALRHFGDPRLPGRETRWLGVDELAKETLSSWISRADVELFFQLVAEAAQDKHWRYRKRFWETYVDYFEASWVALGTRASRLAKNARWSRHAELRSFGRLRDAEGGQSVFIIRMGGYDFVEWSNSGACRAWKRSESPVELGEREYSGFDLRKGGYELRLIHQMSEQYRWQRELARWIEFKTRIKPQKSFLLDGR